jgi:cytochrome P450
MTDALLFSPVPAPPPLSRLVTSPLRNRLAAATSFWRARRNLLHLFHPEVQEGGFHIMQLGPERLITCADADIARHVLADRCGTYVKSPLYHAMLGEVLGPTASLLIEGDASRARRRLLAPAFNARAMARVETVIERHVEHLLDQWAETGIADLSATVPRFAMTLAMDAFFSTETGPEADRLAALIQALLVEAGTPAFADLALLPAWVPRGRKRHLRAMLAELNAALFAIIDARRDGPPREEADLLDVLIGARDAETGAALSRQDLRDEVMTLLLAGHETTALSLIWGLDRLAREPAAQAALREAARGIAPTVAAARALPLASQTFDEILRLYPPAFAIARTALKGETVGPLDIRQGDKLQIAIFMLHRSSRYWDRTAAFRPDRFAGRVPDAFMPFGAGPRLCIGLAFARLEAQHLLCRALSRFALSPLGEPPQPLGKITLRTAAPVQVAVAPLERADC